MNDIFNQFPNLKTERLTLRQLTFNDIEVIYELRSSKEINKLISRKTPNNLEESEDFIKVCHIEFKNENRIFWAIEFKNEVIGTIVYHKIKTDKNYAEIGYELNPDFQQKGLMSEALKVVLEFGIEKMQLKTIEAFTHKNNIASIALLKKHNFDFQPNRKCESVENNRIWKLEFK